MVFAEYTQRGLPHSWHSTACRILAALHNLSLAGVFADRLGIRFKRISRAKKGTVLPRLPFAADSAPVALRLAAAGLIFDGWYSSMYGCLVASSCTLSDSCQLTCGHGGWEEWA